MRGGESVRDNKPINVSTRDDIPEYYQTHQHCKRGLRDINYLSSNISFLKIFTERLDCQIQKEFLFKLVILKLTFWDSVRKNV